MKHIHFLWLLLGCALFSHAQTITITDKQTKELLPGVVLISESPGTTAVTNVKGQADLTGFEDAQKIQIRSLGYRTRFLSYDEIQGSGFFIELEPSTINLDQVVVSATRWRQTSGNIPSKIATIQSMEVALQNPQTAADLLGVSGKVFIQKSQQGGGSPMIRGFATNRLLYTVDGVRMNTAVFREGNLQNVINLDPFVIENTEVLFGPGSVIYGSDAIGGVMSFQTLTPQLSSTDEPLVDGKAIMRYSSANKEQTGHFDVNVGWKKWAFVTGFSNWNYDHLKQGSNGPDDYIKNIYSQRQDSVDVVITQDDPLLQIPTAYSQINLMQKVRFKPDEKWDFQYGFHYSVTSSYGRYDRHNRIRNGTLRYAEWNYGPQMWMMNNLSLGHKGNNAFYDQLSLRLAQQSFEESRIDRTLNKNERTTTIENIEAYSLNLDLIRNFGAKNVLYYGMEFVLNDVTSDGKITDIATGTDQNGPARYPHASWGSFAVYVNDELTISDQFVLQAGIRYNRFMLEADFSNNLTFYPLPFTTAEINNGALTGSIGGVYRPDESWAVKANLGTAFRAPNVDDIGKMFDPEPGAVIVPNPNLKEEYAYNLDLSIAKVFDDVAKIDITGFYTLLDNALVRRDFQLNGLDSIVYDGEMSRVKAIQNAAKARVYGIQAGVEIKLPAGFVLLSDVNFQKGDEELEDGTTSPSRHAAPLFGVTRLRYRNNDITLEVNAMYQGETAHNDLAVSERGKTEIYALDAGGNTYSPSWYTLNLKAMYRLNEMFTITAGLENLTDRRYRPYSSGISAPGRNFILSLRVDF
jgi:hemoglobin/transferrin/lactoferrin receptor protein